MKIGQVDTTGMNETANDPTFDGTPLPEVMATLISSGDGVSVNNCAFSHTTPDLLTKAYFDERIGLLEKSIPSMTQIVDMDRATDLYKKVLNTFQAVRTRECPQHSKNPQEKTLAIWRGVEGVLLDNPTELAHRETMTISYMAGMKRWLRDSDYAISDTPEGTVTLLAVRETSKAINVALVIPLQMELTSDEGLIAISNSDDRDYATGVISIIEASIPLNRTFEPELTDVPKVDDDFDHRILLMVAMTCKSHIPGTLKPFIQSHGYAISGWTRNNNYFQPYVKPKRISGAGDQGYESVFSRKLLKEFIKGVKEFSNWEVMASPDSTLHYYVKSGNRISRVYFRIHNGELQATIVSIGGSEQHALFIAVVDNIIKNYQSERYAELKAEYEASVTHVQEYIQDYYDSHRSWWRKLFRRDPKIDNSCHRWLYHQNKD